MSGNQKEVLGVEQNVVSQVEVELKRWPLHPVYTVQWVRKTNVGAQDEP